jgi:hypothetical protein
MSRTVQNKGLTAFVVVAAMLCGFASTVSAVTGKQLDILPGTPSPNYIGDVADLNPPNGDYAIANMFVGNWFGFEVAMSDATARNPTFPSYRMSISLRCSDNQFYTYNLTTFTTLQNGAEAVIGCPIFTTAQASVHFLYFN